MKLIKILCLVSIVLSICSVASAETWENGTLDRTISGTLGPEALAVGVNPQDIDTGWNLHIDDLAKIGTPRYFEFENVEVDYTGDWGDIPYSVGGPFYIGAGGQYGSGGFYLLKTATTGRAKIWMFFDEDNFNPPVGTHAITIYDDIIGVYYTKIHSSSTDPTRVQWWKDEFGMAFTYATSSPIGLDDGASGNAYLYNYGNFINDYSILMDYSYGEATITRDGLGAGLTSSSYIFRNSTGYEMYNSGYSTSNATYYFANESGYHYLKAEVNSIEYLLFSNIPPTPDFESVGTIELNQTSYTDPEIVQINTSLTSYDFDNHLYRILMYYSDDDGDTWGRLTTSLNNTSIVSSASDARTSDISSGFYDLPIKIKAVLEDYDKTTTTSSVVATSSEVYYNPTAAYDYTFSGTVFDAGTGSPIEGATIAATGATTTSDTSTVTGRFKLYLSDGTYTINCSKSGYVSNVNEDIVVWTNISLYNIYLTQTSYTNGTMNGIIKDADTGESIQDVHLIFTNATDRIDAYTSVGGYYTASGFEQSTSYDIRAIKSGYYSYNGSVTIEASGGTHKSFDMVQINYSVAPTATALDTYPDGEGHAWTNDEIITMLRIVVPGVFMMMFILLLLAVLMGVSGNNGGNGGQGMGMKELWQR